MYLRDFVVRPSDLVCEEVDVIFATLMHSLRLWITCG